MQVDTLLNEADLEAEIASVKQRLTSQQRAYLTEHADTAPGNFNIASSVKKSKVKSCIAVNGTPYPSHSYGVSLAIWDHTVLPATRHK